MLHAMQGMPCSGGESGLHSSSAMQPGLLSSVCGTCLKGHHAASALQPAAGKRSCWNSAGDFWQEMPPEPPEQGMGLPGYSLKGTGPWGTASKVWGIGIEPGLPANFQVAYFAPRCTQLAARASRRTLSEHCGQGQTTPDPLGRLREQPEPCALHQKPRASLIRFSRHISRGY